MKKGQEKGRNDVDSCVSLSLWNANAFPNILLALAT